MRCVFRFFKLTLFKNKTDIMIIKTTCSSCNSKIEFTNGKKQFRICPKCHKCLSIDFQYIKIETRWWIVLTVLISLLFYTYWYIVVIMSLVLRFVLIANGTLIEYTTSIVSSKYCNDSSKPLCKNQSKK